MCMYCKFMPTRIGVARWPQKIFLAKNIFSVDVSTLYVCVCVLYHNLPNGCKDPLKIGRYDLQVRGGGDITWARSHLSTPHCSSGVTKRNQKKKGKKRLLWSIILFLLKRMLRQFAHYRFKQPLILLTLQALLKTKELISYFQENKFTPDNSKCINKE